MTKRLRLIWISLLLLGCASLPTDYGRTPSTAFKHPETTTRGGLFGRAVSQHPDQSGFLLLNESKDAFLTRVAMAEMADRRWFVRYLLRAKGAKGEGKQLDSGQAG
jgi:putative cardiolipin synthase